MTRASESLARHSASDTGERARWTEERNPMTIIGSSETTLALCIWPTFRHLGRCCHASCGARCEPPRASAPAEIWSSVSQNVRPAPRIVVGRARSPVHCHCESLLGAAQAARGPALTSWLIDAEPCAQLAHEPVRPSRTASGLDFCRNASAVVSDPNRARLAAQEAGHRDRRAQVAIGPIRKHGIDVLMIAGAPPSNFSCSTSPHPPCD